MRVLMLNDEELVIVRQVIQTWHCQCQDPQISDLIQSNRLNVLRKISGRYTKEEIVDLMEAATKLLKR